MLELLPFATMIPMPSSARHPRARWLLAMFGIAFAAFTAHIIAL